MENCGRAVSDRKASRTCFVLGPATRRLVLFVHGLTADYIDAWGKLPYLLAANLASNAVLDAWDYAFVGYRTLGLRSSVDVAAQLEHYIARALAGNKPFATSYDEIALVGHSLGALAVRHLLIAESCGTAPKRSITRAMLICEPTFGAGLIDLLNVVPTSHFAVPVISELAPNNGFVRQMHLWADCANLHHSWCPTHIYAAASEMFVPALSPGYLWPNDVNGGTLPGGHRSCIRVLSWNHALVDELENVLA